MAKAMITAIMAPPDDSGALSFPNEILELTWSLHEFAPVCAFWPCFVSGNGEYLEIPRSAVGRIIGAGGARIQAGCTRVGSKRIR